MPFLSFLLHYLLRVLHSAPIPLIYNPVLARIREQLGQTYEFVFLDGEVECDAAPGRSMISLPDLRSSQRLCLMLTHTVSRCFCHIPWSVSRLVSHNTIGVRAHCCSRTRSRGSKRRRAFRWPDGIFPRRSFGRESHPATFRSSTSTR